MEEELAIIRLMEGNVEEDFEDTVIEPPLTLFDYVDELAEGKSNDKT